MGNSFECMSRDKGADKGKALEEFSLFPEEVDEAAIVKNLAKHINLDKMRDAFYRYAGPDQRMDLEEYKKFVQIIQLPPSLIDPLWNLLDINRDGSVTSTEFCHGLHVMSQARAWNRFCPTCRYDNNCDFCVKVGLDCEECDNERFCPSCWDKHPAKNDIKAEPNDKLW
mmetsp:Transcript_45212/g.118679  ORF Transcript_45212/g.118679 Transcript_45212/m.118679 type:complete len:169 (-) Transcript_45212:180-686(-)